MPPKQAPAPRGRGRGGGSVAANGRARGRGRGGRGSASTPRSNRPSTSGPPAGDNDDDPANLIPSDASDLDPFAGEEDGGSENDREPLRRASAGAGRRRQRDEEEQEADGAADDGEGEDEDDDEDQPRSIPPELLTRLLHEFFEKDGTRVSRAANEAVAKYMDVFVRETIARAAVEKESGFLEVEDLEKIAPQVLLDL